jgi:glycosyltransferase involved in cell wall biosynthesis
MGGAEYIGNLVRALVAAGGQRPILLSPRNAVDYWNGLPAEIVGVDRLPFPLCDRFGLNRQILKASLRHHPVDFLFPFTYWNREIGMDFPIQRVLGQTRWAGWIPDFQHRYLQQYFQKRDLLAREAGIQRLLDEATIMVMSSASAARDLLAFHPEYRGKVELLRFATAPRPEWYEGTAESEGFPQRYFAVCNQFWAHKNHLTVFRALALLAERGVRPIVLCTGALDDSRDASYPDRLRQVLGSSGIGEQVRLLGLISRRKQIEVMRRSVAVVQPSLFEGWSTVVEDARVLGRRLLLSDIPVHREQNPAGAEYFEPENVEALAALMERAWRDWPSGPDPETEDSARRIGEQRLREVGYRLLQIAGAIPENGH